MVLNALVENIGSCRDRHLVREQWFMVQHEVLNMLDARLTIFQVVEAFIDQIDKGLEEKVFIEFEIRIRVPHEFR